jgi:predicted ATP-dependent serine protease
MALAQVLCEVLVGRESEISLLEDALLATLRGDGGVVIVGGEAGMGKTRLVADLPVVGRLADSANVSVLGEVTNLAARLQAQSPAGEVTMSEEALRRVSEWLKERQLEPERLELDLKGFAAPVVAYRVRSGVPIN